MVRLEHPLAWARRKRARELKIAAILAAVGLWGGLLEVGVFFLDEPWMAVNGGLVALVAIAFLLRGES